MSNRGELPRRPALPVLFYALFATILTVRQTLREGKGVFAGPAATLFLVLGAILTILACARSLRHKPLYGVIPLIGLSMIVGSLLASLAIAQQTTFLAAVRRVPVSRWDIHIVTEPVRHDDTFRCRARMTCDDQPSADVWLDLAESAPMGSTLRGVGTFVENDEDDWGIASRMQGVCGTVKLARTQKIQQPTGPYGTLQAFRQRLVEMLGPSTSASRALLAGCTCGSRGGLVAYGLDELFARCGLAHLIAVSGSHLAMFSALLTSFLHMLRLRQRACSIVTMLSCGLFVLLCGAPISAVRAWVMVCSSLLATLAGRRAHALSGVCIAGLALVLVDPPVAGQTGYLLSVLAVCGLCLFSPYALYVWETLFGSGKARSGLLPQRLSRRLSKAGAVVRETFCASVVAQLACMPVLVETYGEISLVGPCASVLASNIFALFVSLGMLACVVGVVLPIVRPLLLGTCDVLASVILYLVRALASLPYGTISVSTHDGRIPATVMVLLAILLIAWPRLSRPVVLASLAALVALVLVCALRWRFFAPPRVCVLDVGQGDAILVQQGDAAVLVDTGPGEAVAQALVRNHVTHLDAIVITHLHDDHYAGLKSLADGVACDRILFAKGVVTGLPQEIRDMCDQISGAAIQELSAGDVLDVAEFRLKMIWPKQSVDGNENADSIELLLTYDDGQRSLSGLLTGDAERNETGAVIACGAVGDIDFLKVGHHGSAESITSDEARALDPEVSVASAGEGNLYGHPTNECIETLKREGSTFFCTKDVGDVTLLPDEHGPTVQVAHPAPSDIDI